MFLFGYKMTFVNDTSKILIKYKNKNTAVYIRVDA